MRLLRITAALAFGIGLALCLAPDAGAQTCVVTKAPTTTRGKVVTCALAGGLVLHPGDTLVVRVPVVAPPAPAPAPAPTPAPSPTPSTALLVSASFETGWDGFISGSFGTPIGVDRDCSVAHDGQCSIRRTWVPNSVDGGAQFLANMKAPQDRVWVRVYLKTTSPVSTVMKFARFYDAGINDNFGGLFYEQGAKILAFGFDHEDQAVQFPIGVQEAQIVDGNWHELEFDYWRNGDPSGFPSVAFWLDGNPVSEPDGPAGLSAFWKGGRLYAGERQDTRQMSLMEWLGTLNAGNTTTGQINLDQIAVSNTGRIGP